jgi:hypothetical protein
VSISSSVEGLWGGEGYLMGREGARGPKGGGNGNYKTANFQVKGELQDDNSNANRLARLN